MSFRESFVISINRSATTVDANPLDLRARPLTSFTRKSFFGRSLSEIRPEIRSCFFFFLFFFLFFFKNFTSSRTHRESWEWKQSSADTRSWRLIRNVRSDKFTRIFQASWNPLSFLHSFYVARDSVKLYFIISYVIKSEIINHETAFFYIYIYIIHNITLIHQRMRGKSGDVLSVLYW